MFSWCLWIEEDFSSRSIPPEVFIGKGVLKICSKFTGEHPCRSCFATLLKSHGCTPVYFLHIFSSRKNTSGGLLLKFLLILGVLKAMFSACKTQVFNTHWKSVDWFLHTRAMAITRLKRRFNILQQTRSLNTAYQHQGYIFF